MINKLIISLMSNAIMQARNRKTKGKKAIHKSLDEFYSEEQKAEEHKEKKRKEHQDIEMQIFEHLKEHTKKVLNREKITKTRD